jgi:hypothetical protein
VEVVDNGDQLKLKAILFNGSSEEVRFYFAWEWKSESRVFRLVRFGFGGSVSVSPVIRKEGNEGRWGCVFLLLLLRSIFFDHEDREGRGLWKASAV